MIEQSDNIKDLAIALLKFQAEVRGVLKDSKNPHFKNRYASLEAVVEAARPGLQAAGIVFLQGPGQMVGNALEVSTMLIHAESGQWLRSTMQIPMAKIDPQGAGSAVTYAQRYSLMAALGIPPVEQLDDDAETAMGRGSYQAPAVSKVEVKKDDTPTESQKLIFAALGMGIEKASTIGEMVEFRDASIKPQMDAMTKAQQAEIEALYKDRYRSLSRRAA